MAYWGIAFALGPNYNCPWELLEKDHLKLTLKEAHDAANLAESLSSPDRPIEKGLIQCIRLRFQNRDLVPLEQLLAWNYAYADSMGVLYKDFVDDLDVAALYADSMMTLTPWKLYDVATGQPAKGARTLDVKAVLERALQQEGSLEHPGLLHMYIHLSEMSPTPERGLTAAEHLRDLIPDAGHAHHMPIHLDVLIGDWSRAISSNVHATLADEKFLAVAGAENFYSLYRLHNYHSLIYAAMFAGKKKIALETANRMEATIPGDVLRTKSPNLADWLEGYVAVRFHVMVRFGMWEDIIQAGLPADQELYCVTTATIHYAKGVAFAALNQVENALLERPIDILAVGVPMLDGEISYRRGDYNGAFNHLRTAITLEDRLNYSEPWGWMQPVRHAYAALMLEQNYVEEAADAYRADLGLESLLGRAHHHPNNVWALQGYFECLVRLGGGMRLSCWSLS
ncbi:hypothetical protein SI65_09827 [Aspergillus cristatus]|uniref:MalT-like TPR region domain-containing protein n=1 Tax=Aspergillus cristatus TaxID=573508 RepID=A0A1E3B1L5_ASPCR|nr:hypothetical protein SI65_09827 [Aspergillus cristatus]